MNCSIRTPRTVRTRRTVRILRGGNEGQNHSNGFNSEKRENIQICRNFKGSFSNLDHIENRFVF
jgi:hypothetical protein